MPLKAEIVDGVRGATVQFGTETSTDPASIAAGAEGSVTITVAGADTSDLVFVTARALLAGLVVVEATVTAANTVTIKLLNTGGAGLDDVASSFDYMLVKVAAA